MINGLKACRSRLWFLLWLGWASVASAQPHITQQPALTNSLVRAGSDVTLRVGATGSGGLGFRWRLNGVSIPGATGNIFSLTNIQAAQGGTYDVGVRDSEGVVFSDVVHVVVDVPVLSFSDNFNAVNGKNGSFTNTLPTTGTNRYNGSGRGSNVSATREANEPFHAGKHGKTSVWLTWQPADNGIATLDTKGSGFDTLLAVYTGDSLTNLTAVTANDDKGGYLTSRAVFNADSKTEYHIAVDGQAGEKGDIVLNWKLEPAAERVPEVITQPKGHSGHKGTNVALRVGFTNNVPVTVQWVRNGVVIKEAQETNSDTLSVDDLQEQKVGTYEVRFVTASGRIIETDPVSIQIHSRKDGGEDEQEVSAEDKFTDLGEAPEGPAAAKAGLVRRWIRLAGGLASGFTGTQIFSTYGATTQAGEPGACDVIGGASMWYAYQAVANGLLTIDTQGSDFNTVLGVYVGPGTDFASLVPVACNDNYSTNLWSRVSFAASVGTIYYVAVDGVNGASGTVNLNYHLAPPPTISAVPDQTVNQNTSAGPIPFVITDMFWPATNLTLISSSSNTNLVPNENIVFGGSGTNRSVTITPTPSQAGTTATTITVANPDGAAASVTFVLTVDAVSIAPLITAGPVSQTVVQGTNVTLLVTATGTRPLSYQWWVGSNPVVGETNASLTLTNVQASQAGSYTVQVTNVAGSATSGAAVLTVNVPPLITAGPVSQTVVQGTNVTLLVTATGTRPLSYQWWVGSNPVVGETNASLTLTNVQASQAGSYTVQVTNVAGSATSGAAVLTVNVPPLITAGPVSQTVVQGTNVTLLVTATGTRPLSYQWWVGSNPVVGETNASLTLTNVQASQAGSYTVQVTNVAGSATSGAAVLTVNVPPLITVGPVSQTVVQGTNVTLLVTATGTRPLSYQWWVGSNPVVGETNASLTLTNVQASQAGSYTVQVTNVAGSATSGAAVLTVNVPPLITTQPQSQTASLGGSARFSVTATGTESLHYQWRLNGMDVLGATSATLVLNWVQVVNGGDYTVIVSNSVGAVTSTRATLVVETSVQLISLGESGSGFFQIKLFGTAGSSYVLQASTDLLNWASVLTGTVAQASLTFTDTNSISFEQRFYRVVSNP